MTVTVPPEVADGGPGSFCGLCGRPMAPDQEWCLECGAARTIIARPPDWRVPVLVIAVVVLLIAGGFAFAISQLGSHAGKLTVVNAVAPDNTKSANTTVLGSWQPGEDGYTVLLSSASSRSAADSTAEKLTAHLSGIGVLDTSQHPQMNLQNVWDVYAGRYATYSDAQSAATKLTHRGQADAKPILVQRPGQG